MTIGNNVTSIGNGAFSYCSGLTSVTIPNSMTSIGNWAFCGCSGLTSVIIPNSVTTIGGSAFEGCTGLTSVTIPNSVTSIGGGAFNSCSSLTSVTIPNSVSTIGDGTFAWCTGLTSITIGSGIREIGQRAFASIPNIADIYCLADDVPNTSRNTFEDSYPEFITLHVPESSISAYHDAVPWCNFKSFVPLQSGDIPDDPELEKCAMPTISYENGELLFSCDTEGAEFVYEINDTDVKKGYEEKVKLTATYYISVYATKPGYNKSETATATLCWIDVEPTVTYGSGATAMHSIKAQSVLIQSSNGLLTIEGAAEETTISIYDVNGMLEGQGISRSGQTIIPTNMKPNSVAIVKVGEKAVKVIMK